MARRTNGDNAGSGSVDREIDHLFEIPPEQFVAERDSLAKRLRAGDDAARAKEVAQLRRPTVAAWALDQLARRRPDEVRELVELGDELQRAQRRALSGVGADELRELGARRRRLVERLAQEADEVLRQAGRAPTAAVHQAVTGTLEAATVSPDDAAALLRGRLVRDVPPPSGFGTVDGFSIVPPPERTARTRADRARRSAPDAKRLEAARTRVRDASKQVERTRREAEQADARHRAAEQSAEDAGERVHELERALREARAELDAARQQTRVWRREVDNARRATMRADQEFAAAQQGLQGVEGSEGLENER